MKTMLIRSVLAMMFGLANAVPAIAAVEPDALEPCIDAGASASGLYRTQAEEDAARAVVQRLDRASSGQVPASGH